MNKGRKFYASFFYRYLFPLSEIKVPPGGKIKQHLEELLHTQHRSKAENEAYQVEALRRLLEHARQHSEFYREEFKKIQFEPSALERLEDLKKLPTINKTTVRENLERMAADNYRDDRVAYNTGGSTGQPMQFYIPRGVEKSWSAAAAFRGYGWWGYTPGMPIAYFWSSPFDAKRELHWKVRIYREFSREYYFDAFRITPAVMNDLISLMNRVPGIYLKGFPSAIWVFCRYLAEKGIMVSPPSAVFTTGETLYDFQRQTIGETLRAPVVDFYGNRETNAIIFQCPEHGLYHADDENVIVEIERNSSLPGNVGEIIVTDLRNYATPLIRYRTGDLAEAAAEKCGCGRESFTLRRILGRNNQIMFLANGRILHPVMFPMFFKDVEGISEFQVVQELPDRLKLKLVASGDPNNKTAETIVTSLQEITGKEIAVVLEWVGNIPTLASGKTCYMKSLPVADFHHQTAASHFSKSSI